MNEAVPTQVAAHRTATRVCGDTGLHLRKAAGQVIWRVQKTSWGALNPRVPDVDDDPLMWGRWDVPGHRTIYAAGSRAGAFVETLQDFRIVTEDSPLLTELFDDVPADVPADATLLDAIRDEWARDWGHFTPGKIPKGWRESRNLYELRLPDDGWLVEIDRAASVTAIGVSLRESLADLGVERLTVQQLYEDNRRLRLTSTIAEWVRDQVLDDGSLPVGIRYHSKWGVDYDCFAVWLRALDDGKSLDSEPSKLKKSYCIECTDPWIKEAARVHRVMVF